MDRTERKNVMKEVRKAVGQFLGEKRLRTRKIRRELAEKIGVSTQAVEFWESGKNGITLQNVDKIAEAYELSEDEKDYLINLSFPEQFVKLKLKPKTESEEEIQVFHEWALLPKESRLRLIRTMTAYEAEQKKD